MTALLAASLLFSYPQQGDTTYPIKGAPLVTYTIDYEPFWSPDGKRIALISSRHGGLKLHVLNLSDAPDNAWKMKQLTFGDTEEDSPAWSPDGKQIAFVSVRKGVSQICVMNADGTGVKQLTNGAYDNIHPAWTPDSKRVLFDTSRYIEENKKKRGDIGGHPTIGEPQDSFIDLASVNRDGSGWKRITTGGGYTYAFYSPDGKYILHRRPVGEKTQIWLMNADGSGDHNISGDETQDGWPSWAPDGKRICFVRRINGKLCICAMNRDGSGFIQLTDVLRDSTNPRWSPDGKQILFSRRMGSIFLSVIPAPPG
ncbi:MAG: PD40 domain-containing protein [Armatimonadetes bacterium]|nr:PD40 domain-containing protein [Armatimonadota bacterium]